MTDPSHLGNKDEEVEDGIADLMDKSSPRFMVPVPVELSAKLLLPLVIILVAVTTFLIFEVGTMTDEVRRLKSNVEDTEDATVTNRNNGYKNRAISCSVLAAATSVTALPDDCLDEGTLRYYDPEMIPSVASPDRQRYNTELLCGIIYPDDRSAQKSCVEAPGDS